MFKAAVLLSQQYNITVDGQLIGWRTATIDGDVIGALGTSCLAVSTCNVVGIVGPYLSRETHMVASFAKTIGIPVISYGSTDPDLSDRNKYPTFYRTVPSDHKAAEAIAKLFQRYKWTSCTIIHQNDAYGLGGVKALVETFHKNNLTILETVLFDITTNSIQGNFKKSLTNSRTRIILLWAQSTYTPFILQSAANDDLLGPEFTWILSSPASFDNFNKKVHDKLIGMLTVEPTSANDANSNVNATLLNAAYQIWEDYERETFPGAANISPYALFAFDAAWSLIQALEHFCLTQVNTSSCISYINSSFCFERHFLPSRSLLDTITSNIFLGTSGLVQFDVGVTDRVNGTYYYSRNIQQSDNGLKYIPVLVWSNDHNWISYKQSDDIVWPNNSSMPPSGRPKLEGITLRILIVTLPPFTIISDVIDQSESNKTIYTGYVPALINLLQRKMLFNTELILKPANMTHTQSIEAVVNDDYHMFIGDITISAMQREIAGFSSPIFDDALRIIVRKKPDTSVDFVSFLKPFTRNLWLSILAVGVYSTVLIFLYEREENIALKNKSITSIAAMSSWYSLGTLMGYGVDFELRTAAGRLLTTSLYILSLILVATYTANLASNLTILKSYNIISGIDDIKNGKIPPNRVGIHIDTPIEEFFLREISNGHKNFYPIRSREELIDSLLSGKVDVIFEGNAMAEYITKKLYCNLTLVGAPFGFASFGIVTPKNWVYGEELDINIISLKQSGDLDQLKRKWFSTDLCSTLSDTSSSVGVDALGGLFLIFVIISIISWFLFVWSKRITIRSYIKRRIYHKALPIQKCIFIIN